MRCVSAMNESIKDGDEYSEKEPETTEEARWKHPMEVTAQPTAPQEEFTVIIDIGQGTTKVGFAGMKNRVFLKQ